MTPASSATREQVRQRQEFYGFYLSGEVFQHREYADAMPPAPDMSREDAYAVLQGEAEFRPSMVKPRVRTERPELDVRVLGYSLHDVHTPHRNYTEATRRLSVVCPEGGTVRVGRSAGLFSMADVDALVAEFAAFGVAFRADDIELACDTAKGRALRVPLGVEIRQMPSPPDDLGRLLPWVE